LTASDYYPIMRNDCCRKLGAANVNGEKTNVIGHLRASPNYSRPYLERIA
jgi:hypothetical protein